MNIMQRLARGSKDPVVLDFTRYDLLLPSPLTFLRGDAAACATRRRINGAVGPSRTNYSRNSSGSGGAVGTPPSGWGGIGTINGITAAYVGATTVTLNGESYTAMDVRYQGTASAGGTAHVVTLGVTDAASAALGQPWVATLYAQLVAGALGDASFNLRIEESASTGSPIPGSSVDSAALPANGAPTRLQTAKTTNQATVDRMNMAYRAGFVSGSTYDFTVRIYAPMLEKGLIPTPTIRTTGATASATDWPRTNKCQNVSANPRDTTTNMTKGGDAAATFTLVDDRKALEAAGLGMLCSTGIVYKLDNSAGVTFALVTMAGGTGHTGPHSVSVFMRATQGQASLRFRGTVVASTTSAAYTRVKAENQTPSTANDTMGVRAEPGAVVYFILNQLEEGDKATAIIPVDGASRTVTTPPYGDLQVVAANAPRLDYTPDGAPRGLLIEPSITNAVPNSRGTTGTAFFISYNPNGVTATLNYPALAPDGSLGVARYQVPAGSAPFNFSQTTAGPGAAGVNDCMSFWIKAISIPDASFSVYAGNSTSTEGASFVCTVAGNKVTAVNLGGIVRDYPDGWQKITLPYTTGGAITMGNLTFGFGGGTGAPREMYFWQRMHYAGVGGQVALEQSDVFTDATAKTRQPDNVKLASLADIGFNPAAYTLMVEWEHLRVAPSGVFATPISLRDAAGQNFLQLYVSPTTGNLIVKVVAGGVVSYESLPTASQVGVGVNRVALALTAGQLTVSVNGAATGSTNATIPLAAFTEAWLGSTGNNSNITCLHGWFRKVKGWGRAMSQQELQAETA